MADINIARYITGENQPNKEPIRYNYSYTVIYQEKGNDVLVIEYPAQQLPFLPHINEQVVLDINMFKLQEAEILQTFDVKGIVSVLRIPRRGAKLIRTDIFISVSLNTKDSYQTAGQTQ